MTRLTVAVLSLLAFMNAANTASAQVNTPKPNPPPAPVTKPLPVQTPAQPPQKVQTPVAAAAPWCPHCK